MSPKPLLISLTSASLGGYLELTHAPPCSSKLTALTPLILLGTGFWALMHGFAVGAARAKYAELARKDGEKDVDERYLLPNLYAQGTSKHVRAFNCMQRSHQQIFETFTTAVLSGVVGCITFPVCTALSTFLYAVGRYHLSKGYADAEGEAGKRYQYPLAMYMWYGFLGNMLLGMGSCALMIVGGMKTPVVG